MRYERIIPRSIALKIDSEKYGIEELVRFASKTIAPKSILLDAGAGTCPYKQFFSNINYIAIDFKKSDVKLDVIADLASLPFKNSSIDAILCTQVLEHVKEPKEVIQQFYHALKAGGSLFATVPQGWGLHNKPHDYFRFASYALDYLFKKVGFNVIFIKPRGGYFWYIGNRLQYFPSFIKNKILKIFAMAIFCVIVPLICFHIDQLDKNRDLTLGYSCFCKK